MPRLTRAAAVLVLLLQALVAGLLPVADARAEAAGVQATATAHVEAPDAGSCPAVHDELACQLCPLLRLAGAPAGRVALPPVERTVAPPPVAQGTYGARDPCATPDHARAPPLA